MIQIEPCKGCGRTLFMHRVANLVVRLEIEPLDGPAAYRAIIDGRELWRATATGLSPAKPDTLTALATAEPGERPHIVQTHRCRTDARQSGCTAAGAPVRPSPVPEGQPTPPGPSVGRATPFSGPRTAPSSARSVDHRRSDPAVPCSSCGQELDDPQTRIIIELGATLVDAYHSGECPA